MEITESQKKYIILALSILCAAMLLLIISTVIGRAGKTAVSFVVSPDETQIEFNNQKITGSRTVYLKPGEYSFKATRDGFRENTIQTTIKDKPVRVVFALTPTGKVSKSEKSTNAPKGYKNAAINEIRKAGFDPSKLNINFRDYANPFTE